MLQAADLKEKSCSISESFCWYIFKDELKIQDGILNVIQNIPSSGYAIGNFFLLVGFKLHFHHTCLIPIFLSLLNVMFTLLRPNRAYFFFKVEK